MKTRGFTFIEVIVIMTLVITLSGFLTINVVNSQRRASLVQVGDVLASDLSRQQVRAMTGESVSGVTPLGYGVKFENNRYILFTGSTYVPTHASNTIIPLGDTLSIAAIGFPNNTVVFASGSGEIVGYVSGSDYITLRENNNGQTRTIRLNRYGVDISTQ